MSELSQPSNARIAKNAVMLYIRMFFTMLIGLYTSCVVRDDEAKLEMLR